MSAVCVDLAHTTVLQCYSVAALSTKQVGLSILTTPTESGCTTQVHFYEPHYFLYAGLLENQQFPTSGMLH